MKKFEYTLIVLTVILIGIMSVGMFSGMAERREDVRQTQKVLERENRKLGLDVWHYNTMFGKYVDSVSDEMLRDFYPEASNIDSLRSSLKETYERYVRTRDDGLCY